MNITKIILIALIACVSTLFTLWIAAGMTTGYWFAPVIILGVMAIISDKCGFGSISEFLES